MNILRILFILTFFLLLLDISYSQENINIPEGNDTTICGKIVVVDALWVYEGTLRADISILEKQNSKPITGGYKKGDEITLSSDHGCIYYIYSITKLGSLKSKGLVTFSISPPVSNIEGNKDVITQEENSTYKFGKYDWFISSIRNDGGSTFANITITHNTALIDNLVLTKGDLIWLGERLYKVKSIQTRSEFIKTDPERIYEPLPGKIEFKAIKEYLNEK